MSIQPGERERARFDVRPPDRDRGPGPRFGQALRRHWRVVVACIGGLGAARDRLRLRADAQLRAETRLAVGGLNASTPVGVHRASRPRLEQLAETDSRAVQGDAVVRDVAAALKTSPEQVRPHLSAAPVPQTPVFTVTATTKSAGTSIDMSRLAAEALAREANRASDAAPGQLLKEYQRAEREREQAEARVATGRKNAGVQGRPRWRQRASRRGEEAVHRRQCRAARCGSRSSRGRPRRPATA